MREHAYNASDSSCCDTVLVQMRTSLTYQSAQISTLSIGPFLLLLLLLSLSLSLSLQQHYGSYLEEQWCQLYLPDGEVAYFNKLTGVLQYGGRPDDFRPNLKVRRN